MIIVLVLDGWMRDCSQNCYEEGEGYIYLLTVRVSSWRLVKNKK